MCSAIFKLDLKILNYFKIMKNNVQNMLALQEKLFSRITFEKLKCFLLLKMF